MDILYPNASETNTTQVRPHNWLFIIHNIARSLSLGAKVIVSLAMIMSLTISAYARGDIYVSPQGNDKAKGTKEQPYATLAQAIKKVRPGQTIWLRGGTYNPTEAEVMGSSLGGLYSCVFMLEKSGTADKPLTISAFPGEQVIFDMSQIRPEGHRVSGFWLTGKHWHIKGLEVVGIQVTIKRHTQSENFSLTGCEECVIEQCSMHSGMGIGVYARDARNCLILNCDAYNNCDSISKDGRGGNSDGFGFHLASPTSTGNVIKGCRAWLNSDDGFDLISNHASVTIDSCWAWRNGYDIRGRKRADGVGIKAGGYGLKKRRPDEVFPRNVIKNSICVSNRNNGFYANHHLSGNDWYNNRAYGNGRNYNMVCQKSPEENFDIAGYGHVLVGNVGFRARSAESELCQIDSARCQMQDNLFGAPDGLTPESFVSLDVHELEQPRKADGSLPDTHFMELKGDCRLQEE